MKEIFAELSPQLSDDDKFDLAVLCGEEEYIKENADARGEDLWPVADFTRNIQTAVKTGSVAIVQLLLEYLNISDNGLTMAFVSAASGDCTDIIEVLHKNETEPDDFEGSDYQVLIYTIFKEAISHDHKNMVQKLIDIYRVDLFDINSITTHLDFDPDNSKCCLLCVAADMQDPVYVKMLLKAKAVPDPKRIAKLIESGPKTYYSPVECAIYKGNYETLIMLLVNSIEFYGYDYIRVNEWLSKQDKSKGDPRLYALVDLMLYRHEIKNAPSVVVPGVFHQDEGIKEKEEVCEILFDAVTQKCSAQKLEDKFAEFVKTMSADK